MRARQKVSRAGVELIKSFEGLRQTAARLPDGRWTIGYGHTFSAREGARVTQEDADALLRFDLLPIVDSLNNMILVPVNQNQFDALVSFSFNIGIENFGSSSVLKRINEGRMTEAALAMDAWRSAEFNGQTYVLAPLIRRRAAEKNLFLTPEDNVANASSLLVRPVADVEADAASARPSELDAPDRGGVLSAYPTGHAPFTPPVAQTFVPETPSVQPVFQPAAPQPVTPLPVASQPTPVETAPVEPQPIPPSPAAPLLSPYAAATYASEAVTPTLPLSPYAGVYTPPAAPQPVAPQPEFVAPAAAQPVSYDRQFIDLTSITPRPMPEAAPAPVQAAPQSFTPQPAAPQPAAPQPILQPSDFSPYSSVASPYVSPYAQPAPQPVASQPVAPQPAVLQPSDISPYPPAASLYISPYAQPVAPQPAAPQPVAPSPAAFAKGEPPVVEMLPGGFATPSQIRETPVQPLGQTPEPAAPTAFDPAFGSAMMSPEVAAALARAQDEQRQRDEAERLAQQAAARAAEEARIRELQRQEAERLEQQRQEQDRFERARLDAERQERERNEAARLEQSRVEQARLEQERADQARAEQARLEQERLERDRAEQARLEAERLDRERAEQARLEAERVEREQQAATAAASAAAATAAVAVPPTDEAEKARKAEAAAALMRLYSPYGGGPLGRPLGFGAAPITQANLTPSPEAQSSDTASVPKPEAPQAAEPEPEAAKRPVDEFVAQSVIAPATAAPVVESAIQDDVQVFSTRVETRNDEDEDVSSFRPFTPIMSAANMPAPIVTALNPYASPLPQAAVREATETVVEVPRPEPVVLAPVAAPVLAEPLRAESLQAEPDSAPEGLHWRERLQRPLPADHQPTAPDFAAPERQASLLPKAAYAGEYDDTHAAGEDWLHDGRIAMSNEEMEEHTVSWWRMLLSTFWWIMLSLIGIISLGVAAGAYYKSRDLSVIRNGLQQDMEAVSIVTAVIGFVLVSTSMWLMMRRLGGLKEQ